MKLKELFGRLERPTQITLLCCACVLALAAVILLFLMLFPIQKRDKQVEAPGIIGTLATEETAASTTASSSQTEASHTLSTWSASIIDFTEPAYHGPDDSEDDNSYGYGYGTTAAPYYAPQTEAPQDEQYGEDPYQGLYTTAPVYESTAPETWMTPVDTATEPVFTQEQTQTQTVAPDTTTPLPPPDTTPEDVQ